MLKDITKLICAGYFLDLSRVHLINAERIKGNIKHCKDIKNTINIKTSRKICINKVF